jgi:TolB-like protein/Flp pilus assembly protein TadD
LIGKTLDHYEITDLLGKGGMGEVYRARDTKLERDVALKVLPAAMAADPARLERFEREAKTVAGLNHPHIVTLYSVEEAEGVRFLTMELVEGQGLDRIVTPDGLELSKVFDIGIAVADALAAAHEKGIVHRDLKPANVMITKDGRVKVLDFGLAKLIRETPAEEEATEVADLTRDGAQLGTVPYMSPEQLRGQDVDARSDIFSLGILIFELATGKRPFDGASSADVISSILRETPSRVTQLRSDLPSQLERIVARCLAKEPERRFQSAGEVYSELEALRRQVDSGVGEAGNVYFGSNLRRSEGLWVGLTVVAVVIVALVLFLGPGDRPARHGVSLPEGGETAVPVGLSLDPRSIAVMAFADMSPGKDQEYFSDGIAEELLNVLARVPKLKVVSRSSSFSYKGKDVPLTQVARELGVAHILEGSVRKAGNTVRITAQLIEAGSDSQLWSETYDRELDDIFAIQDDIAFDVVEHLKVTLLGESPQIQQALDDQPTESVEAYQAYLQGLEQLNAPGFSRNSFELGVQMFERAIAIDREFALAYARLSSMNARMYHYGFDRTPERLARAKAAAESALELEPDLAEAHLALGHYYYWGATDYHGALGALDNARRYAPNLGEVLLTTAYVKRRQGDFESAIESLEEYRALSPIDPNSFVALGETYGTLRRYEAAEQAFERARVLAPDDPYPSTELSLLHLRWHGDTDAARAILDQAPRTDSSERCRVGYLIELLDRRYDAALERLENCPDAVLEASAFYTPTSLIEGTLYRLQDWPSRASDTFGSSLVHLEEKLREEPNDHRIHAALGLAYAGLGRAEEAVRHGRRAVELHPLEKDALEAPVQIVNLALIHTMVGQHEAALEQLDTALSVPSILSVAWLREDPRWDGLRDLPSFEELLRKHTGVSE